MSETTEIHDKFKEEHANYEGEPKTVDREFMYAQDSDARRLMPGGTYLDDVQRAEAETNRARLEGRKPDYKNMPSATGDVIVPKSEALRRFTGSEVEKFPEDKVVTLPVVIGTHDSETRDLNRMTLDQKRRVQKRLEDSLAKVKASLEDNEKNSDDPVSDVTNEDSGATTEKTLSATSGQGARQR